MNAEAGPRPPFRRADLPVEARLADLLARMTLEEMADQLHQCGLGDANPNNLAARADEFRPTYGSFILNGPRPDLPLRNALQRRCVEESRLGIPAIFGCDVIHGYRAIFPIPLAQACAWDPALLARQCAAAAAMARAQGVDWTFAPMVDHCVDPRWGRIAETFGESVHATTVFAAAAVRGYQGDDPGGPLGLAACLKHFAGYGASEGGRDYSFTSIGEQQLWEDHLPPFEAGVRAGALTVMSAFNDLNGTPATAHRPLLTDVLRSRWGFAGLVVSDWNAVLQLRRQGAADDDRAAARLALLAGVDLDMADGLYRAHLPGLVRSGLLPPDALTEAVRRVLRVKFRLGLFERPYVAASPLTGAAPTAEQLSLAREAALRSIVLLKNESATLPLAPPPPRLALIGPLAEERAALLGSWAQQGRAEETATLAEALRARIGPAAELLVHAGCPLEEDDDSGFAAAIGIAQAADAIVVCVGESASMSGENASRAGLHLPGRQEELARAIARAAAGKPLILVLISGRPLIITGLASLYPSLLAAWQPGSAGADALADILCGTANPSGRLAITWPRHAGQIPLYHHERPRARPEPEGLYQDTSTSPLFPFGHGLSYTTFRRGPLTLSRPTLQRDGTVVAELLVENTGPLPGRETVLWFLRDPVASVTRPLRELKHFESAELAPGERRLFRWEISPERDLSFPGAGGGSVLEPGVFRIFVAGQEAEFRLCE